MSDTGSTRQAPGGEVAVEIPDRDSVRDRVELGVDARRLEVQRIGAVDIARTMFKRQPGGTLVWVGNKGNLADLWEEQAQRTKIYPRPSQRKKKPAQPSKKK